MVLQMLGKWVTRVIDLSFICWPEPRGSSSHAKYDILNPFDRLSQNSVPILR